jgi:myo-inositol-1(or 4)-monophosphatase
VAARRGGRTLAGAVYAPMMDELYTAAADGPARRNGEILRVSATERLEEAIVTAGFVKRADDRSVSMNMIEALCPRVQKLRVMGAAALDLCNVAGGRVDGYVESRIFLWDVAAGSLIVERAGGRWEVVQPLDTFSMRFVASNGRLHDDLRAIVAGAWGG